LSAFLLVLAVAAVAMLLGIAFFDVGPLRAPAALLWIALSGTALTALMMLLQLHAGSQRSAHLLTNMVLFPLIMIGGTFFPFEAMPAWIVSIGRRTPNGWALEELKAPVFGRPEPACVARAFAALVSGFAALPW